VGEEIQVDTTLVAGAALSCRQTLALETKSPLV
jgi:hypothetical protein